MFIFSKSFNDRYISGVMPLGFISDNVTVCIGVSFSSTIAFNLTWFWIVSYHLCYGKYVVSLNWGMWHVNSWVILALISTLENGKRKSFYKMLMFSWLRISLPGFVNVFLSFWVCAFQWFIDLMSHWVNLWSFETYCHWCSYGTTLKCS